MNLKSDAFQYKCQSEQKSKHNRVRGCRVAGDVWRFPKGQPGRAHSFYRNRSCLSSNKTKFTTCRVNLIATNDDFVVEALSFSLPYIALVWQWDSALCPRENLSGSAGTIHGLDDLFFSFAMDLLQTFHSLQG